MNLLLSNFHQDLMRDKNLRHVKISEQVNSILKNTEFSEKPQKYVFLRSMAHNL